MKLLRTRKQTQQEPEKQRGATKRHTLPAPVGAPHVVIIGGGFAGLLAARELAQHPVRITLVDRQNHHLFQPLLYQVATAAISPGDIAEPLRALLKRNRNIRVLLGEATGVDLDHRVVRLADGELAYDALIVATGASHTYFGHDEWAAVAPGLKTLDDALEIRRRILSAFEAAERATDPALRDALLTFVIVGGGPTGVELAGAIAEIARHTVAAEFRDIDPATARIVLVEGQPNVLGTFPSDLSAKAAKALRALGVEVRTGAVVTGVTPASVQIGPASIPTHTVLWAAGIAASPLGRSLGAPVDRAGRVQIEPDLTLPGHPEVYVVGDLATLAGPDGKPLPGIAPVAMQQGVAAAGNVWRALRGEARQPFRYNDRGTMAVIGRGAGIANLRGWHLSGPLGWLAWLFVHILFLVGFERRLLVVMQWAWSFFTHRRGVRLITRTPQALAQRAQAATPAPKPATADEPELVVSARR